MKLCTLFLILFFPIASTCANDGRHTAEYARITSGCWTVDVWNTPTLGHRGFENGAGDMRYFACDADSTFHPLFESSLIVGWIAGSDTVCYSDMMGPEYNAGFMPLDSLSITMIYNADSQESIYQIKSLWCTPDSMLSGEVIYRIPINPDTSVIFEKVTIWSISGSDLENFIIGAGFDWNVTRDTYLDNYGFIPSQLMMYQRGSGDYYYILAGAYLITGSHVNTGACILPNAEYIDPDSGYNPKPIYGIMAGLDNQYISLADPEENINTIYRFWKGTLSLGDTLSFCFAAGVSLTGESGIMDFIMNSWTYDQDHEICMEAPDGWGLCGDANFDTQVNVSDAVWIINYIFLGGPPPDPNLACGDVNEDHSVNVSDAAYLINFIFVDGPPPDYCAPDYWPIPCWPYGSK